MRAVHVLMNVRSVLGTYRHALHVRQTSSSIQIAALIHVLVVLQFQAETNVFRAMMIAFPVLIPLILVRCVKLVNLCT